MKHQFSTSEIKAPMISCYGLHIGFPTEHATNNVVRDLSFTIDRKEIVSIVGESGSGKSLTSLALLGLLPQQARASADCLRFHDRDLLGQSYRDWQGIRGKRISMIFQEPMTSLNPVLTIGRQMVEALEWHEGLSRKDATRKVLDILDQVRIPAASKRIKQYPHELSGGMRQRVMIAQALTCGPELLIADEPTTALDVTVQSQILGLLEQLRADLDMGILLITHDMGVVAETADKVVVMNAGDHVETGTVEQIFAQPENAYTKKLLASVPRLGSGVVPKSARPETSPQKDAPLLEVEHLQVRFDQRAGWGRKAKRRVHAVEDVSFRLGRGETLALVGESGSGKSTLARAILNLIKPGGGTVRLKGKDITGLNPRLMLKHRRVAQMIFQDPYATLDPRMRVGDQVAEPIVLHGLARGKAVARRVQELFELVGLDPAWARRHPHEFSGGQRQRICIARALAVEPELIIADEAVSALDVTVQAVILDLLKDIQQKTGISYLFITHDLAVVEQISHRVAVMYLGRLVELGSTQAVLRSPSHRYTRSLLQAVPVADPTRRPQRVQDTSDIPSPIHDADWQPPPWPMRQLQPDHWVAEGDPLHEVAGS